MHSIKEGCNFCLRHGMPILPVRPAVIAQDDPLSPLPGSITMPVQATGGTAYTARLLRQVFLYIWVERGQHWLNYYVTDDGYFYPLPEDGDVPPLLASGQLKPCITSP